MRALLLIPGPLGERLSAPEVRGWNMALELRRRHAVVVAAQTPQPFVKDRIEVMPADRWPITQAARRADVVIAPWVPPYLYATLWGTGTLLVADMYNPAEVEFAGPPGLGSRLLLDTMRANDRLQLRFADLVLCAVDGQRQRLSAQIERLATGPAKPALRIVPFGVDNDPPPTPRRRPIRERLPAIKSEDMIVLWWGNVWRWFDADTALRAFAEVSERRPNVKLVFTGGRPPRQEASLVDHTEQARGLADSLGLLGSRVLFLDEWIPYEERHEYLQEADLGLTLHRDTPEKDVAARGRYMDYLWARLPCVLAAGDELSDRFGAAGFAATVPPGDVRAAASSLGRLLDHAEDRNRAARAADGLLEVFRWSATVKPLLETLDALGGSRPVRSSARPAVAAALANFYVRRLAHEAVTRFSG